MTVLPRGQETDWQTNIVSRWLGHQSRPDHLRRFSPALGPFGTRSTLKTKIKSTYILPILKQHIISRTPKPSLGRIS